MSTDDSAAAALQRAAAAAAAEHDRFELLADRLEMVVAKLEADAGSDLDDEIDEIDGSDDGLLDDVSPEKLLARDPQVAEEMRCYFEEFQERHPAGFLLIACSDGEVIRLAQTDHTCWETQAILRRLHDAVARGEALDILHPTDDDA